MLLGEHVVGVLIELVLGAKHYRVFTLPGPLQIFASTAAELATELSPTRQSPGRLHTLPHKEQKKIERNVER